MVQLTWWLWYAFICPVWTHFEKCKEQGQVKIITTLRYDKKLFYTNLAQREEPMILLALKIKPLSINVHLWFFIDFSSKFKGYVCLGEEGCANVNLV